MTASTHGRRGCSWLWSTWVVLWLSAPLLGAHHVQADSAWEVAPLPGENLAGQSLDLQGGWNGGVLRIRLTAVDAVPPNWHIHLAYTSGQTLDLDASNSSGRIGLGLSMKGCTSKLLFTRNFGSGVTVVRFASDAAYAVRLIFTRGLSPA